jgi:hypothetical protein
VPRTLLALILTATACGGTDPAPGGNGDTAPPTETEVDTDTAGVATQDTGPHDWMLSGEDGSLVAVDRSCAPGNPGMYEVHAAFGSGFPEFSDVALCLSGGTCAAERPGELDAYLDLTGERFPSSDVTWTWVGDIVEVDRVDVNFTNEPDRDYAYYTGHAANAPEDGPLSLYLPWEGQWGEYAESVVPTSPGMKVISPNPSQRVSLASGSIDFSWEGGGEGEVYLRIDGEVADEQPISVLYALKDDGSFTLDLTEHRITPESDVRFGLGRRVTDDTEINGNQLQLTAISEALFAPECLDAPEVDIPKSGPATGSQVDPYYMAVMVQGVIDGEELKDYYVGNSDVPKPARVVFSLLDQSFSTLCTVEYNADDYIYTTSWTVTDLYGSPIVGASMWAGFQFNLGNGKTDCGPIDPAFYFGMSDVRDYLERLYVWGYGIGPNLMLGLPMSYAGYTSYNGLNALETNPTDAYDILDCHAYFPGTSTLPRDPSSGVVPYAYYETPNVAIVYVIR